MRTYTAIIGTGVTGMSCLRHLAGRDRLLVLDTRGEPANGAAARSLCPDAEFRFGADACGTSFDGVDRVIVSPGIGLDHELVRRARQANARIESDIDLFCQAVQAPVYAVTGTNGKSTVTALAGHLLAGIGADPGVGGNLGEAALDLLQTPRDCYVLELSSFQLERMGAYPFRAATVLNVSEDHLDRHGSLIAYAAAKRRIYTRATRVVANRADPLTRPETADAPMTTFGLDAPGEGDWGVMERDDCEMIAWGSVPVVAVDDLPLPGSHNVLNVLAACALVVDDDVDPTALAGPIRSFRGLPHRCQPVAEKKGVRFIDDSKATNVGAALAALDGLGDARRRHIVLIAGGDGKGADFSPLAQPVARFVKAVVLLGRDAPALNRALAESAPIVHVPDMNAAVAAGAAAAAPGDLVLLSPACASLDMFRSYEHRGRAFAEAVEALP